MGLQLEFYFKAQDLKNLTNANPAEVFITVSGKQNGPDLALIASADGYDANGNHLISVKGCPSPCHPGGTSNSILSCAQASNTMLNYYSTKGLL
jgi:hypothetical protein